MACFYMAIEIACTMVKRRFLLRKKNIITISQSHNFTIPKFGINVFLHRKKSRRKTS